MVSSNEQVDKALVDLVSANPGLPFHRLLKQALEKHNFPETLVRERIQHLRGGALRRNGGLYYPKGDPKGVKARHKRQLFRRKMREMIASYDSPGNAGLLQEALDLFNSIWPPGEDCGE